MCSKKFGSSVADVDYCSIKVKCVQTGSFADSLWNLRVQAKIETAGCFITLAP